MPVKCCVPGCNGNYDTERKKVSVFRFPVEKDLRNKWLQSFPRKEWTPGKWSSVCEEHFEPGLVKRRPKDGSSKRRSRAVLAPGAVPTIFPYPDLHSCIQKSTISEREGLERDPDPDQESCCLPLPHRVNIPEVQIKTECPDETPDESFFTSGIHLERLSVKQEPHMDNMQWSETEEDQSLIIVKEEPPDEEEFNEDQAVEETYLQNETNSWDSRRSDDRIQCKMEAQNELVEPLVSLDNEKSQEVDLQLQPQTVPLRFVSSGSCQRGLRPLLPKGQPGTLLVAPILSSEGTMLIMRVIATAKEPPPLVLIPNSLTGVPSANNAGTDTELLGQSKAVTRKSKQISGCKYRVVVPEGRWTECIPDVFDTVALEWIADEEGFKGKFRASLHSVNDCLEWLSQFEQRSNTNWILMTSRPESGHFLLSRNYVCHLSRWKKSDSSGRCLDCKAALTFRVKKLSTFNKYRDPFMAKGLPGIVQVSFKHSHSLDVSAVGRWLRRRPWLREVFMGYFQEGMTPAAAMRHHEEVLLAAEGADQLPNRSLNPPPGWVYHQFRRWRRARDLCGATYGEDADDNEGMKE